MNEAWAAIEDALPESGWLHEDGRWVIPDGPWAITVVHVDSGDGYSEPFEEGFKAFASMEPGLIERGDLAPSPAGALQALAAKLRAKKDAYIKAGGF